MLYKKRCTFEKCLKFFCVILATCCTSQYFILYSSMPHSPLAAALSAVSQILHLYELSISPSSLGENLTLVLFLIAAFKGFLENHSDKKIES